MIRLCAFADEASSSLEGQIAALKRNDISLIELRSIDGVNVKDISLENARIYAAQLANAGIDVWSIGSPLGKVDIEIDFSEYEKIIRHICELSNIFTCGRVRVFSFFHAYEREEMVLEKVSRMVEIAREYGVQLYHENEKEIYGDTVERVQELMDNVEGLKFIYDPANFVQTGEETEKALSVLMPRIDYYHIKDVSRATDEIVPAGEGDSGIEQIIFGIEGDKVLTLEPHLALFEGFAAIDNTKMKNKYQFQSNDESFDFAAQALKKLLNKMGYKKVAGDYVRE